MSEQLILLLEKLKYVRPLKQKVANRLLVNWKIQQLVPRYLFSLDTMSDDDFEKFRLTSQYDFYHAAELLGYASQTLLDAHQIIMFKIEDEEQYLSILKQIIVTVSSFLVAITLFSLPELAHVWIKLVIVATIIGVSLACITRRTCVMMRFIYLKNLLTLTLDYQKRGVALPKFYTVNNISIAKRCYLKVVTFIKMLRKKIYY